MPDQLMKRKDRLHHGYHARDVLSSSNIKPSGVVLGLASEERGRHALGSSEVRLDIGTMVADMGFHLLMLLMGESLRIEPERSATMI